MISRPKVVLVVEDEIIIRMLIVGLLADAGFHVLEIDHTDLALAVLESKATDIHVLFTDIHVPGAMNGLELAHHASRQWPWIALLITSGKANPRLEEMPPESRFLPKPYDPDHVVSHVREMTAAD